MVMILAMNLAPKVIRLTLIIFQINTRVHTLIHHEYRILMANTSWLRNLKMNFLWNHLVTEYVEYFYAKRALTHAFAGMQIWLILITYSPNAKHALCLLELANDSNCLVPRTQRRIQVGGGGYVTHYFFVEKSILSSDPTWLIFSIFKVGN